MNNAMFPTLWKEGLTRYRTTRPLTTLTKKILENIVGKGYNPGNKRIE